jgi:hypothetical protein
MALAWVCDQHVRSCSALCMRPARSTGACCAVPQCACPLPVTVCYRYRYVAAQRGCSPCRMRAPCQSLLHCIALITQFPIEILPVYCEVPQHAHYRFTGTGMCALDLAFSSFPRMNEADVGVAGVDDWHPPQRSLGQYPKPHAWPHGGLGKLSFRKIPEALGPHAQGRRGYFIC